MKIPKNLFFIWFGDNKPDYVDFAVKIFKEVNPDFNIQLLYYTQSDINYISKIKKYEYDIDLINCINYITNYTKYQKSIDEYKDRNYYLMLSDIFRLELIYKYGGIYLDCDTFPIKPFDDKLLEKQSFKVYSYSLKSQKIRRENNFFLGNNTQQYYERYQDIYRIVPNGTYEYLKNKRWLLNKELFFNCQLKYIQNLKSECYIEHYNHNTWRN